MTICIYCKKESTSTKGLAHVLPEAIFTNDIVLPIGVVCDSCNNYLAELDKVLMLHNHIGPIIQILGLPGKSGKVRKKIGHVERNNNASHWRIQVKQKDITKFVFDSAGVHVEVKSPSEFDDLKFRRALHHVTLNFLALSRSADYVLDDKFNPARNYIRQPREDEKWPYLQVIAKSDENRKICTITEVLEAPGKTILLQILGDDFYVDLLNTGELLDWGREALTSQSPLLQA
jgi:hypothetical protein